jgi:hypothetical protein
MGYASTHKKKKEKRKKKKVGWVMQGHYRIIKSGNVGVNFSAFFNPPLIIGDFR